ncbi:MAG TPA: electron transport complex subunit RsxC [Clostridiales bacterium]|jgi:electron transport complex protein RnfC|nr:electron transport complex subunit RsxC [Clostridiales bacterium]
MSKKNTFSVLKAFAKVRGGVRVKNNKNTADMPVERIPTPRQVVLPMVQHIGVPCNPTVEVGDIVAVGQVVGDTDSFVSAPIHASISGKVIAIGDVKIANGKIVKAVTIESDDLMTQYEGIKPPHVTNREDFLKAVRESGLVGLGGAGFPTHVKIGFDPSKNVDTLVVNAAECEPYITVDYRECMENSWDILSGIRVLIHYLGFKQCIIAIEDNKPDAIEMLSRVAAQSGENIRVMALKSKYPQGAEKLMVLSTTGRVVPIGKLPVDVGCVVMNVASVAFISRYLKTGVPLVSRSITVDGTAIKNPKNVRVPVGISVREIIEFCGGYTNLSRNATDKNGNPVDVKPYKLITGGPMMGTALVTDEVPILKSNNAILAFANNKSKVKPTRDCIHCGRCAEACPMSLSPLFIMKAAKARDVEMIKKSGIDVCMECGSCAYACPSGLPLVQHMRLAKQILREER